AQLTNQKEVVDVTGVGITIGSHDAKHTVIKVCNPYCGPCAKAHPIIDDIINSNIDVQVRIVFLDSDDEASPVRHLLAIAERGKQLMLEQAMDDWYLAEEKDFSSFVAKYPIADEVLYAQ